MADDQVSMEEIKMEETLNQGVALTEVNVIEQRVGSSGSTMLEQSIGSDNKLTNTSSESPEMEDERNEGTNSGQEGGEITKGKLEGSGASENIQTATETYELPEESRKAKERQQQLLRELELKRRARALAVPTSDSEVRSRLRALEEPITLFGEKEMERRERLRQLMAQMDAAGQVDKLLALQGKEDEGQGKMEDGVAPEAELFYTEGSVDLLEARKEIALFSLRRAAARIARTKRRREDPDEDEEAETAEVLQGLASVALECSEIGDKRPLSGCALSVDGALLATCGWSGLTRVWTYPDLKEVLLLKGHTERVTSVAFHPRSGIDLDAGSAHLATAGADRKAILWSRNGQQLLTLEGHFDRLARLAFHPSGRYVGTASFDKTWRLWDVTTGSELLLQEGHSRSVYGIAFHGDGSLAATCGLDALTRVWDLRTGRSILALEGHVKPVLGVDFSPNGFQLATGGEDHTCRVWDLRQRQCAYIIPAHSSLVSQVRYEPQDGAFLVTASYDNTARVWSGWDFKPIKTLAGHEGKVMGVDVAPDGHSIVSVSYDRTIKLWSRENRRTDIMQ